MEVYYEEKPVVKPSLAPHPVKGMVEDIAKLIMEHEASYALKIEPPPFFTMNEENDDDRIEEVFNEVHQPVGGRIYKVKGLDICAKYVGDVYTPLTGGKIRSMSHHKTLFYVDAENLVFASDKEVEAYLEESDCNIT